jgi:hypothetical protein
MTGQSVFFALFPGWDSVTSHNGPRQVFHPKGLRPFFENWESVAARIIQRVHREAADNPADKTMKVEEFRRLDRLRHRAAHVEIDEVVTRPTAQDV